MGDYFDEAADQILAAAVRKAPRQPGNILAPPVPTPSRPKATSLKKLIRAAIRAGIVETDGVALHGEVNTLTNRVYKRVVRPALARVWREGYEAGADAMSACCGCSPKGFHDNPYEA